VKKKNEERETHHGTGNAEETSLLAGHLGDPVLKIVGSLVLLFEAEQE
jgi:hypothetical protein